MGTRINEYGEIVREEDPPRLNVVATRLNFEGSGETRIIHISVNKGWWAAKVEEGEWISLGLTDEENGIWIRLPQNASTATRYGRILIYTNDPNVYREIEIVQEGDYIIPYEKYEPAPAVDDDGCLEVIWEWIIALGVAILLHWIFS